MTRQQTSPGDKHGCLTTYLVGRVDYESAMLLQERSVSEAVTSPSTDATLFLCEYPAMLSIGRDGSRAHLKTAEREWVARRIPVRWVKRGGGCWLHGPGQLVANLVVPLASRNLSVTRLVREFQQAAIDACEESGFPAKLGSSPGIWSRNGQVGMLGIAVRRSVAYHGIVLNVSPKLSAFPLVQTNPADDPVTSIASHQGVRLSMPTLRERLAAHLASRLGFLQTRIYSGHPLLTRSRTDSAE